MLRISDTRIDGFIAEDVPYVDLTCAVLGIGDEPGEMEYFTREDCVLAGANVVARIMGKLGCDVVEARRDGERATAGEAFFRVRGTAGDLHAAWKVCLNVFDHMSAVATKTRAMVDAAHAANPRCEVLTTRKSMPGAKDLLTEAVMAGGAFPHRLGLSETVLVFDHHLTFFGGFEAFVEELPDIKGRQEILAVHAKNKPLAEDVDLEKLAKGTSGFTGADLENLLNEAALLAGRRDEKAITMADLQQSVIKVIAGPEKHSRVIPEHERRLTAYHEAGHAVVMHTLPDLDPVHQITIVPRGQAGGMTIFLPDEDRSYLSRTHLLNSIAGLLGGRAAEQLVLGDISTGASNDISRATQLARKMVGTYGMSDRMGSVAFDAGHDEVFIGRSMAQTRPYSEETAAEMDREIRRILDEAYGRCTEILERYRPQLTEVAEFLLQHETMTAQEFEQIFASEDKQ